MPTKKIAIYGKGGIGKSTVAASLSMSFAENGLKVLHVGCDPKHDSTYALFVNRPPTPIIELLLTGEDRVERLEDFLVEGRNGIDLVESGGPEPGIGCGGRGIARMLDIFTELDIYSRGYDISIFDVLGDVVCGGFAAPLRKGFADTVFIVVSEEFMSIYAANNVARMVKRFSKNGLRLGGLIVNRRDNSIPLDQVEDFAKRIKARILAVVPRDKLIREAEQKGLTVIELAPESDVTALFHSLRREIETIRHEDCVIPEPMTDEEFFAFARVGAMEKAT